MQNECLRTFICMELSDGASMTAESIIRKIICSEKRFLDALAHAGNLPIQDIYITGGFLRNLIWNAKHGYPLDFERTEIDLVYYDRRSLSLHQENKYAKMLPASFDYDWSLKNQARMHKRNGHKQYNSLKDAIAHYPDTATANAVRSGVSGSLEFISPYGLEDLYSLVLRPTHFYRNNRHDFEEWVERKGFLNKWPRLQVITDS